MSDTIKYLAPFTNEDQNFFGRDKEIQFIHEQLKPINFLLIYGKSGSGKTSIVRCGLQLKLKDKNVDICVLQGINHRNHDHVVKFSLSESIQRLLLKLLNNGNGGSLEEILKERLIHEVQRPIEFMLEKKPDAQFWRGLDKLSNSSKHLLQYLLLNNESFTIDKKLLYDEAMPLIEEAIEQLELDDDNKIDYGYVYRNITKQIVLPSHVSDIKTWWSYRAPHEKLFLRLSFPQSLEINELQLELLLAPYIEEGRPLVFNYKRVHSFFLEELQKQSEEKIILHDAIPIETLTTILFSCDQEDDLLMYSLIACIKENKFQELLAHIDQISDDRQVLLYDYCVEKVAQKQRKHFYIVLDQFEEIFTKANAEEQAKVVSWSRSMLRHPNFKVIWVVQEEYIAMLTELENEMSYIFDHRFRLTYPSVDVCRTVLEKTLKILLQDASLSQEKLLSLVEKMITTLQEVKKSQDNNNESPIIQFPVLQSLLDYLFDGEEIQENLTPIYQKLETLKLNEMTKVEVISYFLGEKLDRLIEKSGLKEQLQHALEKQTHPFLRYWQKIVMIFNKKQVEVARDERLKKEVYTLLGSFVDKQTGEREAFNKHKFIEKHL